MEFTLWRNHTRGTYKMADLIAIRKQIKKRKPTFKRSQTNQFAKFKKDGYRKPKGMGNKMRRQRRGHIKLPTVGYGSPKELRGANKQGLIEVLVSSLKDLESIDTKTHIAVISSTVGGKKRLALLNEAKKKGLQVAYINDIDAAIKKYTKEKKAPKKKSAAKTEEAKEETKADDKKVEDKPAAKKTEAKVKTETKKSGEDKK